MEKNVYGSSFLTLDAKGRLVLPARYREFFEATCDGSIVVTRDPQFPSLVLYPGALWKEISSKFISLGGLNNKVRAMQWMILGNAHETEFSVSERMTLLIPQILRDHANLKPKKQVAFVGMGKKFEIWDLKNWEKIQKGEEVKKSNTLEDLPPHLEEIPF